MRRITLSALTMLALLGFGCGDDDTVGGTGGTSGSGGTGGTGAVTAECTGDATDDPNCINVDCGDIGPIDGPLAKKGLCCFRASNADRARAAWDAGETATLEYRQNALKTLTQTNSVGNPLIQASLANGYENDWSNTMTRIEGVPATGSGPVTVTIGAGRYNCDGTYSFFGDGAAPVREGRTDTNRWKASVLTGTWDWDATEKLVIDDATRPAGVKWSPVGKDFGIFGYEQPAQDLNYEFTFVGTSGDTVTDEALNCAGGELTGPTMWTAELVQTVFFPVADMKTAFIDSLTLQQNFCGFMALGYMAGNDCDAVAQADWVELPVGMCDADHCYVGEATHPDADCGGTTGRPCCSPDGTDTALEPCNAFLIEARAVLGGAEITDAPHTDSTMIYDACTI